MWSCLLSEFVYSEKFVYWKKFVYQWCPVEGAVSPSYWSGRSRWHIRKGLNLDITFPYLKQLI